MKKKSFKFLSVIMALLFATPLLGGCGSGDGDRPIDDTKLNFPFRSFRRGTVRNGSRNGRSILKKSSPTLRSKKVSWAYRLLPARTLPEETICFLICRA